MPIVSALAALTRAAYLDDPPADEQREAYKALAHDARMRVDALRDERNELRAALREMRELVAVAAVSNAGAQGQALERAAALAKLAGEP